MAWEKGSQFLKEVIEISSRNMKQMSKRREFYKELILVFEDYECNDIESCFGIDVAFDKAYQDIYPEAEIKT